MQILTGTTRIIPHSFSLICQDIESKIIVMEQLSNEMIAAIAEQVAGPFLDCPVAPYDRRYISNSLLNLALCSRRIFAITEKILYTEFSSSECPGRAGRDKLKYLLRLLERPDLAHSVC